jgi:hypothetical protein
MRGVRGGGGPPPLLDEERKKSNCIDEDAFHWSSSLSAYALVRRLYLSAETSVKLVLMLSLLPCGSRGDFSIKWFSTPTVLKTCDML